MSAAKRSRSGQAVAQPSASPASKRQKVSQGGDAPSKANGLAFLVDENDRSSRQLKAELSNGLTTSRASASKALRTNVAPDTADDDLDREESSGKRERHGTSRSQAKNDAATAGIVSDVIDISSDAESDDLNSEDEAQVAAIVNSQKPSAPAASHGLKTYDSLLTNGKPVNGEAEEVNSEADADAEEEAAFGELLLARHEGPINVQQSLGEANGQSLASLSGDQTLAGLSSATLGTVLTQALKTNDKEQLETCFQVNDPERIRATIQRLSSQHVATLLQRISERIYSRPGRTGNLFIWIQWSLVVHGGYLASHEDVMKKLKSLSRVIKERARGLQPLLHLKGKIDMLSGQIDLRRSIQQRAALMNADAQDNEEDVIYIEGQDDDWSDEEGAGAARKQLSRARRRAAGNDDDDVDMDDGPRLLTNGESKDAGIDSDDEGSEDEEEEDSEGLLDLEAEETSDDDEADSDDGDNSDADLSIGEDASDDESENEGVRQAKLSTLNRRR